MEIEVHSPVQEIREPLLEEAGVRLLIRREDLIHEHISGNKWRKLKYNLKAASEQGMKTLLTFGGAYSNHIAAVAYAGKAFGFNTTGIIRGEPVFPLNPTLQNAVEWGMRLHFIDRETYREKDLDTFTSLLRSQMGDFYRIPEGGANEEGIRGCMEILHGLPEQPDVICCACGTGTTLAGIIRGAEGTAARVIGFSALKGAYSLDEYVKSHAPGSTVPWIMLHDYHFGGYAKIKPELMSFITGFETRHTIPLEPVYTGKMLFGVYDLIRNGYFARGTTLLAIHTGGLQGNAGFGR